MAVDARRILWKPRRGGSRTQCRDKDFTDAAWTALGQMDDAESVKRQGQRLKSRPGPGASVSTGRPAG
jgi:hypothetical protein